MKIKYMGTAAAEGIPGIFCQCQVCTKARQNKGKDIRGRSGIVIDDQLLIDCPPDIYMHSLNHNIDLSRIKDILITHTHSDHFDVSELLMREPGCFCYINEGQQFVNLYGNEKVGDMLNLFLSFQSKTYNDIDYLRYKKLNEFETVKISYYNVTPLLANHTNPEKTLLYVLEKDNITFLYAHDTGVFKDKTFDFLKESKIQFDYISFDCTTGLENCTYTHMGIPNILTVKEKLEAQGNLKPTTKCIISHFSHNCGSIHEELVEGVKKYDFIVAYDGMEMELI